MGNSSRDGKPADMLAEGISVASDGPFTVDQARRLSWWKASYQFDQWIVWADIPDPDHMFARRLAFVLWLMVTRRVTDWPEP